MDSSTSTPSRRSYDIPKPETGLAEWTSKIKALQREVDADEEAEQKRLEEEISAARQARLRRSRGAGGRGDSIDISSNRELFQDFGRFNDNSSSDITKSITERVNDRDTTLRKLMAKNEVYNPDKIISTTSPRVPAMEVKSLASFIGGRASGPRLNRHAPQQDVHDPTQFIQPDLTAPHPVFGKGGIAMPGMASNRDANSTSLAGSELSERYQPSSTKGSALKLPIPVTKAPESRKEESFDIRRRSFTTPQETPNFPSTTLKDTTKVVSLSDTGARTRNEASRDKYTTGSKANPIDPPSESPRPPMTSSASKPLPSYLGTNYPTKYTSPSSTPVNTQPFTSSSLHTPLGRLMETNNVYNPDIMESRKTIAERAQTVSLAGFIGGKSRGPRLNKHAPQPNAHDPTQFIQPDTSAPHPIFGRGGVAMPGLASRKTPEPYSVTENGERYRPSPSAKAIWPPVKTSYAEKPQDDRPISPQKAGNRERTLSTPGSRSNIGVGAAQSPDGWSDMNIPSYEIGRRSPSKGIRSTTPGRDRTISTPSNNSSVPITTPTLARPIQPVPKVATISPLLSSTVPSPAFQKPTASKDLTPSISRLQGRGFVQSMVKVSSQLDTVPPTPPSADKPRPVSATGRKSSVLDRWQPHTPQLPSPTKSYTPMRRSATQEPTTPTAGARSSILITDSTGPSHSLKYVASLPSLAKSASASSTREAPEEPTAIAEPYQRSKTPGLGSATTMVLIKPSKSATDLTQLTRVDELGVKHDLIAATSSKKPLIHPTKERARKPKKLVHSHNFVNYASQDPVKHSAVKSIAIGETVKTTANVSLDSQNLAQMELPDTSPRVASMRKNTIPPDSTDTERSRYELSNQGTVLNAIMPFDHTHAVESLYNDNVPVMGSGSRPTSPIVSFNKRGRIPNTGNRPTVMEVAQALIDQEKTAPSNTVNENVVPQTKVDRPQRLPLQVEKQRSTHDKYSTFVLPSLKEEATPMQTPVGTLNPRLLGEIDIVLDETAVAIERPRDTQEPSEDAGSNSILFDADDTDLPTVEVAKILKSATGPPGPALDTQTISVDLVVLVGTTASPVVGPSNIFYEPEILVVVHRTKSKSSSLASTSVWCWLGRRSILGDREEKRLHELAKRYGTSARIVYQLAEPPELIQSIGGTLVIRQGSRTHWSPDNTTMHVGRSLRGIIVIDEVDLTVRNLCSAFSYCFTILGSVYVWHGHGSTMNERTAIMEYAKSLINGTSLPIELLEGESDHDDIFWMILGEEDFARADYWKWRKTSGDANPLIWRVEPDNTKDMVISVDFISLEKRLQNSVYIINCIWELFVLVGKEARSNRRAIRLALDTATRISREVSSSRPYTPTVHVLVLPSQIPLDLQSGIRDIDEAWLNNGEIPDHMNLLSYSDASSHLTTRSWGELYLKDQDMLPLGVGSTDMS